MDLLHDLMENLTIDDGLNGLIGRLREFDLSADMQQLTELMDESNDLPIEELATEPSDIPINEITTEPPEKSIDELCEKFQLITLDNTGVYLQHISGTILFIPYGQCGLHHKKSFINDPPKWVIAF